MRTALRLISCAAWLSFALSVFAQEPVAPDRDPQALAVLQQAFAAVSNVPASDFRDSVVQARVKGRDDASFNAITIKTLGRSVRTEAGTRASIVARGRAADQANGLWREARDPNAPNRHADHLPAALLAELLRQPNMSLAYVGVEQKNGAAVHHIRAVPVHAFPPSTDAAFIEQLRKNETLHVFIDTQSGLLVGISFVQVSVTDWRRGATIEIAYSDYRTFGGTRAPAKQRRTFNGQLAWELELDAVASNVGLSASEFTGRQ